MEHEWDVFWRDGCIALRVRASGPRDAIEEARPLVPSYKGKFYPHMQGCQCTKATAPCLAWTITDRLTGTPLGRACGLNS